jgi:predicted transcriptional regulator
MKLMVRKYGSREAVSNLENVDDWQNRESVEFSEAFDEIVRDMMRDDPNFIDKLKKPDDALIQMFSERIELLHALEIKILQYFSMLGRTHDQSDEWRSEYNKKLMRIIHTHPEFLEEFMRTEDTALNEQQEVLFEIEKLLY